MRTLPEEDLGRFDRPGKDVYSSECNWQQGQGDEGRHPGDQDLNSKNYQVISMCEVLERKDRKQAIPYESDADKTDEEIVEGLMEITALSLTDVLADEPAYE
jgi:hypothetical protein